MTQPPLIRICPTSPAGPATDTSMPCWGRPTVRNWTSGGSVGSVPVIVGLSVIAYLTMTGNPSRSAISLTTSGLIGADADVREVDVIAVGQPQQALPLGRHRAEHGDPLGRDQPEHVRGWQAGRA